MEQSKGQRVNFVNEEDDGYDCQNIMNEVPLHNVEFQPTDLYICKFHINDIIQTSQKRDKSTHIDLYHQIHEQNQFLDEESKIYQENEDRSNQVQNSSTSINEQIQQSSSKQSDKKNKKYIKKKDKILKSKPNNCDSKNFFLFLWKKVLKAMKGFQSTNQDQIRIINSLKKQSGSIQSFNSLFSQQIFKVDTQKMFRQKYFNRCIMISPIDSCTKKRYLGFVRRVETCYYTKKRIDFLR